MEKLGRAGPLFGLFPVSPENDGNDDNCGQRPEVNREKGSVRCFAFFTTRAKLSLESYPIVPF